MGRGFLAVLAASAAGAALSGGAAAVTLSLYPPGGGTVVPAWVWGLAGLPVAAALALAGVLSRTAGAVAVNAAAFLLPQAGAVLAVFVLFAHPGGGGGAGVVATGEFWLRVAAAYALVCAFVGAASLVVRLVSRRGGG
jgi:hypothetical protein